MTRQILLLLLSLTLISAAGAELNLVSSRNEGMESGTVLRGPGDKTYFVSTALSEEKSHLRIYGFAGPDKEGFSTNPSPVPLILLAPRSASAGGKAWMAGADGQGKWHLLELDEALRTVRSSRPAPGFSLISEVAAFNGRFFVGGANPQGRPAAEMFDPAGGRPVRIALPAKEGQVGNFLAVGEKVFATVNFGDGTSSLYELLPAAGRAKEVAKNPGGAAFAIVSRDGSVLVAYRSQNEAFVRKLGPGFKELWAVKLHDIKGGTTLIGELANQGDAAAWVGANQGRLTVHLVSPEGKVINTFVDQTQQYALPHHRRYWIAGGDQLDIRGQSLKPNGAPDRNTFVSFHFHLKRNK